MTTTSTSEGQVARAAARVYEEFFVPALFGEWAPRTADALAPRADARCLDVGCGTGVLMQELARRVAPSQVTGVDRNEGMLAVAQGLCPGADLRVARAEELPFSDASFDAVGCQFALMFLDRTQALREMWRVLAPGGRLAVTVWGPVEQTPGYASMVTLLERLFGSEIADELRAPFCLGDERELREVFAAAGLDDVELTTSVGRARFASIERWVETDVRGWTLADKLDDAQYATLQREAQQELAHTLVDGRVDFASPAHIVTVQK